MGKRALLRMRKGLNFKRVMYKKMRKILMLEEGLSILEEGIVKARLILDGYPTNALFTPEEYMKYYDCVYYMCVQQPPYDYAKQLLVRYEKALEESILSRVLPSLSNKSGDPLLIELLHMWTNYKTMFKCLIGFFLYLDRRTGPLHDISIHHFHRLVYNHFHQNVFHAAVSLITQDRNEQLIDRNLLKNISMVFTEIGGQGKASFYDKFEEVILADTTAYYSILASRWLLCYSSTDYLLKVEKCLNDEKVRASHFLYQSSVDKLLQVVHYQLIDRTANQLIEMRKAENQDSKTYQELLSRCAGLSIG